MATLTDTVPNITYPDAPVITTVTGATFDVQMESYDSSLVEYTGQVTYILEKTSSQSSLDFSGSAAIEPTMNTLTQDIAFTGLLQATIVKVSSAVPLTGFTHASSSFGEGTGASTTTGTGPTQDDSYEILIQ